MPDKLAKAYSRTQWRKHGIFYLKNKILRAFSPTFLDSWCFYFIPFTVSSTRISNLTRLFSNSFSTSSSTALFCFDAEAVYNIIVIQLCISMASLIITSPFRSSAFNFPNPDLQSVSFHHSFSSFTFKNSRRLKRSLIAVKYSNPQNPNSRCGNYISHLKNISVLVPIFNKFKDFASRNKWVSVFQGCNSAESFPWEFEGRFLQNGAFGMALLSVTSTAKVKISPFVATLAANPTFVSALFAWAIAQSTKVFLNFWVERTWDLRILISCGGMPSSHSALCTALTTSVAICHGVADSLFPVCLGFSLIVMYDAIGVRRHAGMQAEVTNFVCSLFAYCCCLPFYLNKICSIV